VLRSAVDNPVEVDHNVVVQDVDCVRVQGLKLDGTGTGVALLFDKTDDSSLAACVVTGDVEFDTCGDAEVVGNTFDYPAGTEELLLTACTDALLRNNVFVNNQDDDDDVIGMSYTGAAPDEDYNCWYPEAPSSPGAHSVNSDPDFATGKYFTNDDESPIVSSGVTVSGFGDDYNGWLRHSTAPCMGAYEFEIETTDTDANGRVDERVIAGVTYTYGYDGRGQLISFGGGGVTASYEYDYAGRRVEMTVGDCVTRFVYDGDDVCAEFVDEDDDGDVDRRRHYWLIWACSMSARFRRIRRSGPSCRC